MATVILWSGCHGNIVNGMAWPRGSTPTNMNICQYIANIPDLPTQNNISPTFQHKINSIIMKLIENGGLCTVSFLSDLITSAMDSQFIKLMIPVHVDHTQCRQSILPLFAILYNIIFSSSLNIHTKPKPKLSHWKVRNKFNIMNRLHHYKKILDMISEHAFSLPLVGRYKIESVSNLM